MIFEGYYSVIKAIKEKKRLMDANKPHEHIKPLLIQGGGMIRCVYGAGGVLALEDMGYTKTFTSLVGISSGTVVASYFASGEAYRGIDIFTKDMLDTRFINPWRFWNQVNTQHFIDLFRENLDRKINVQAVIDNPTEVYFGVANYKTAKPVLFQSDNEEYFFKSMHASINMSNISPLKIVIDGVRYTDGVFASPHVFQLAVEQIKPTHVLIVTNNDQDFKSISKLERFLNRTLFRLRLNGLLAGAINSRKEARNEALEKIMSSDTPAAVVWGDGSIGAFENKAEKIKATIESSRIWWHGLFTRED